METREEIVKNWLPRYTGRELEEFPPYILLTNFDNYVSRFTEMYNAPEADVTKPMPTTFAEGVAIINFGMGSPNAATVMDLLSAINPEAVLFLGKCGGLKSKSQIGDFILPIGAIRGEGTSDSYFPKEVPSLPAFNLQKAVSTTIRNHSRDYWTGVVYTTNRRVWEHDDEFKNYLRMVRAMAIDMETATLFSVGFRNKIPAGALLLISDQPMVPDGVKTAQSDKKVTANYTDLHIDIGVKALHEIKNNGETVRHLKF